MPPASLPPPKKTTPKHTKKPQTQPTNHKKGLGNLFLKLKFWQCYSVNINLWKTCPVLWVVISSTLTSSHEDLEHNGKCIFLCGIPEEFSNFGNPSCLPVHNLLQGNYFPFIKEGDFIPFPPCFSLWMGKHLALLS